MADERGGIGIVLLAEEELFLDVLQCFPASGYETTFAATVAEAAAVCDSTRPRLLVTPVDVAPPTELAPVLERVRAAGAKVLGLRTDGVRLEQALAAQIDRLIDREQVPQVLGTMAALLRERRASPRATVAVPVMIHAVGRLVARVGPAARAAACARSRRPRSR